MIAKNKVKKEKKEKPKKLPVRYVLIYELYESPFSFMSFDEPKVLTFSTLTELQKWLKKNNHLRSVVVYEVADRIKVEQNYQFKIEGGV